jgi:hypothetical protein
MSAASSAVPRRAPQAASAPARQPSAHSAPPAPRARASQQFNFSEDSETEFRLNLSDIPRIEESMDVEGFQPSILSRLFDLIAPLKR